jgi:hypothetical protein
MEQTYQDGNLAVYRMGGMLTRGWRLVYTHGTQADLMLCLDRYFGNGRGDGADRAFERCRTCEGDPTTRWVMEISNDAVNRARRSRAVR